jgi:centrosomal protein CEP120
MAESTNKNSSPEQKEEKTEEVHSMTLSIDIRSVKGLSYEANLGISYSLPIFNAPPFSTSQPIRIPRSSEGILNNAFMAYPFKTTKSELYAQLSTTELLISALHSPKSSTSPKQIGIAVLKLSELLGSSATLQKTPVSSVRAYDVELPLLESGTEEQVGSIRVVAYLEDLGTVVEVVAEKGKENSSELANVQDEAERRKEYETLWELETWKKAEEAKFSAYLKDKLQFHLAADLKLDGAFFGHLDRL